MTSATGTWRRAPWMVVVSCVGPLRFDQHDRNSVAQNATLLSTEAGIKKN